MKNFYPLLFFVLFIPLFSIAQSNYMPGYVVTLNGDTAKGYIDYENRSKNPNEFNFKANLIDAPAKSYSTADAGTVVITGSEIYKRFTLQISRDEVTESRLSVGINKNYATNTVFLKVINQGKYVTLYEYRDDIKDRYFIDENNNKPIELTLNIYLNTSSATESTREDIYKRQLQALAIKYQPDNHDLVAEIQGSDYAKTDLENVVFKINGSDNATTFSSTRKFRSRVFAGLGVALLGVHDYAPDNYIPEGPSTNVYTANPAASVELNLGEDIFLGQSKKSLILRTELHFTYSAGSTITGSGTDSLYLKYNSVLLDFNFNPNLLVNIYSNDHLDIYLGGGIALFVRAGTYGKYVAPGYDEGFLGAPAYYSMDFTFKTSADVILNNKFDFYAGYDPVSTIGQKNNTLSTFHLGINYLFGHNK